MREALETGRKPSSHPASTGSQACSTTEAVYRAPGGIDSQGKTACAQFYTGWFENAFPDAHVQVHDSHIIGDVAVEEGTFTGTHQGVLHSTADDMQPTGSPVTLDFLHVLRYQGGCTSPST